MSHAKRTGVFASAVAFGHAACGQKDTPCSEAGSGTRS